VGYRLVFCPRPTPELSTWRRTGSGIASASMLKADEELADQLLGKAQAEGVELLGPDGLLSQVTKAMLERALTEVGAVDLAVLRDRSGTFEPQIVRKDQTRLKGFNERIIALYARHDHPGHPRPPARDG
jgi:Transposase, Mutator family